MPLCLDIIHANTIIVGVLIVIEITWGPLVPIQFMVMADTVPSHPQ